MEEPNKIISSKDFQKIIVEKEEEYKERTDSLIEHFNKMVEKYNLQDFVKGYVHPKCC